MAKEDKLLASYRAQKSKPIIDQALMDAIPEIAKKRLSMDVPTPKGLKDKLEILASGKIIPGVGVDYEKARLRQLKYEKITIENHAMRNAVGDTSMVNAIVGYTDLVFMEEYTSSSKEPIAVWEVGKYKIIVPLASMINGKIDDYEFINLEDPHNISRHPHHARRQYGISTCWGGFATPIIAISRAGDVTELMRQLRSFVGRYNAGSPLTRDFWGMRVAQIAGKFLVPIKDPYQRKARTEIDVH